MKLYYAIMPCLIILLNGCATPQQDSPPQAQLNDIDISKIADAKPKIESKSIYGNPPSYVVFGKRYQVLNSSKNYHVKGIASWYGMKFNGQLTSNHEYYDVYKMTAAHKTLPIPCYAKVTNLINGKHVIVKINDRGPFKKNRIIDLSYVAAVKLGIIAHGTGLVSVDTISPEENKKTKPITLAEHTPTTAEPTKIKEHTPIKTKPNIFIQVGAYSMEQYAKQIQQILSKKIPDVACQISPLKQKQRTLYRVQIGPIKNVELADNITTKLEALNVTDPQTVIQ